MRRVEQILLNAPLPVGLNQEIETELFHLANDPYSLEHPLLQGRFGALYAEALRKA